MNKRFILANLLVFTTIGFVSGCRHEDMNVLDREPNLQGTYIPSGYQSQAVEAAGGMDAWTKETKLQLDSLVTFYQPDGSFYLTRQKYIIYPWSNSIEVFGKEPQGDFAWRLSQGQFEVLEGIGRIPDAENVIDNQCLAAAILSIITAPVSFMDRSVDFAIDPNPLKIQGLWYYRILRQTKIDIESILRVPKAVFYQNRDNSIIEMIWIDCPGVDQFLTVRGYDYDRVEEGGIIIPQRIEIFLTDSQNSSHKRLVKIDVK
jgi:hypothetical protein